MPPKTILQWTLLMAGAGASVVLLRALHVPGAVLLGPMLVAIGFALSGAGLELKPGIFLPVQAVLGCMVASVVSRDLLQLIADHWAVVLAVNVLSVVAAAIVAVVFTHRGWLPGQSAIWGLSPGAASTMMMLGEQQGADPRVIALMQHLRIVFVTLTAVAVAGLVGTSGEPAASPPATVFLSGAVSADVIAVLAVLIAAGVAVAIATKWRQAAFWLPLVVGSGTQLAQLSSVQIPAAVAAVAFAVGGCYAGLRFNKKVLLDSLHLMPAMLLGILLMTGSCIALMWPILRSFEGVDALTAFLAIMPGGIDAAVAVAHGMHACVPVILAVQVMRLIVVTILAPQMARLVARYCVPR
ncbi:membrane AbrB-like protein [Variovorax paradoxus]|uniref:Membrane AbrB-like protein n=1 Tax=Variovorax paradoxus TaxID=34073 RepID=A0AAE3Y2Y1_VARPD|nr:AbrB family transcriptional regulator [Variovorax paradoxus]MDP9965469.1 membrane AbrB-like protein [Variovorax paradoxus]MDR6428727.1 membrane AbrB-like protein [Variovorax paradoxus]MDR6455947.1 membrane AbrB-like protein [Variovorax paradoxus]